MQAHQGEWWRTATKFASHQFHYRVLFLEQYGRFFVDNFVRNLIYFQGKWRWAFRIYALWKDFCITEEHFSCVFFCIINLCWNLYKISCWQKVTERISLQSELSFFSRKVVMLSKISVLILFNHWGFLLELWLFQENCSSKFKISDKKMVNKNDAWKFGADLLSQIQMAPKRNWKQNVVKYADVHHIT